MICLRDFLVCSAIYFQELFEQTDSCKVYKPNHINNRIWLLFLQVVCLQWLKNVFQTWPFFWTNSFAAIVLSDLAASVAVDSSRKVVNIFKETYSKDIIKTVYCFRTVIGIVSLKSVGYEFLLSFPFLKKMKPKR